jgi:hypothetical protein
MTVTPPEKRLNKTEWDRNDCRLRLPRSFRERLLLFATTRSEQNGDERVR